MENEKTGICPRCGAPIANGQGFCGNCGAPLGNQMRNAAMWELPLIQNEKDFFKAYASKNTKSLYTFQIVLCFFSAAIGLINTIVTSPLCLIDLAFCSAMGICMLIRRDRVFPIMILAYSIIGMLMSIVSSGVPAGILELVIAGLLIRSMNKLHRAYLEFLETGVRPTILF